MSQYSLGEQTRMLVDYKFEESAPSTAAAERGRRVLRQQIVTVQAAAEQLAEIGDAIVKNLRYGTREDALILGAHLAAAQAAVAAVLPEVTKTSIVRATQANSFVKRGRVAEANGKATAR